MASVSDSEGKAAVDNARSSHVVASSVARTILAWPRLSFPLVAALLGYAFVLVTPAVLNDPDTYWHIATGSWILDHRAIPRVDPFSFTMAGQPWVAHEWLSELLMALAYRALGWNGLVILFGIASAATVGALARYLARHMSPLPAAIALTLGALCVGPSLLARPHLLALPVLIWWTIGLLQAQESRIPPPFRLLPLMLIWANLHASFIFGLALIAPIALQAVIDAKRDAWRVARNWSLFFVATLATTLLTPHGWRGVLFPFQLMSLKLVGAIGEWRPLDLHSFHPIEAALVALLYVVASRRVGIPALRLLIAFALLYLAFKHSRHEMLAGMVGAAVLAEPLGRAFGRIQPPPIARGLSWRGAGVAAAIAVLLTMLRFAHPILRGDDPVSPVTALAAVPAELLPQPVFNDYEFGGYLIFRHIKPFIDGRADMYGDAFMFSYLDASRPDRDAFERLAHQYRIRWALLATGGPMAHMVAGLPGWRRIHRDDVAAVFVNDEP